MEISKIIHPTDFPPRSKKDNKVSGGPVLCYSAPANQNSLSSVDATTGASASTALAATSFSYATIQRRLSTGYSASDRLTEAIRESHRLHLEKSNSDISTPTPSTTQKLRKDSKASDASHRDKYQDIPMVSKSPSAVATPRLPLPRDSTSNFTAINMSPLQSSSSALAGPSTSTSGKSSRQSATMSSGTAPIPMPSTREVDIGAMPAIDLDQIGAEGREPGHECEFKENCDLKKDVPFRKVVSHFFGRNKKQTRAIPASCWVQFCRKHYQRAGYRNSRTKFAIIQAGLVKKQLLRLKHWGKVKDFTLQLRRRETLRLEAEKKRQEESKANESFEGNKNDSVAEDKREADQVDSGSSSHNAPLEDSSVAAASGEKDNKKGKEKPTDDDKAAPVPDWLHEVMGEDLSFDEIYNIVEMIESYLKHADDQGIENAGFPDIEILPNGFDDAKPAKKGKKPSSSKGKQATPPDAKFIEVNTPVTMSQTSQSSKASNPRKRSSVSIEGGDSSNSGNTSESKSPGVSNKKARKTMEPKEVKSPKETTPTKGGRKQRDH